jgi:hypothetical protein
MTVFSGSMFGTGIENLACLGYIRGRYNTYWKTGVLTLNHLVLVRIQVRQLPDLPAKLAELKRRQEPENLGSLSPLR